MRLVHTWRRAAVKRRPGYVAAHSLLVHRVPGFVYRTEQALVEELTGDARRDANVVRAETAREGMGRDVLAPALEVIAKPLDDLERVRDLEIGVEIPMQGAVIDRVCMPPDIRDEWHDRLLELGEDRLQLGRLHARLGAIEERVVGAFLVAQRICDAPVELDVLLEVRGEQGVVLIVTSFLPDGPRHRAGAGDLGDQVRWELARLLEVATRDADQACVVGIEVAVDGSFERIQQPSDLARRETHMRQAEKRRKLLGA